MKERGRGRREGREKEKRKGKSKEGEKGKERKRRKGKASSLEMKTHIQLIGRCKGERGLESGFP